jgi:AAHS family 4-hydroxybenzoate transporter-like MFS transporter
VRYLALRQPDSEKTRALARRIAPGVVIDAGTRLIIHVPPAGKFSIADLFRGERRISTPLLWVGYFADSLTYMTLISWFTTLLADQGVSATDAANAYSWGALLGIVGGLMLARLIDRFGPLTTVATALVGMTGIMMLALADMTISTRLLVACTTYAVCNITHNSLNAAVGSFYPTSMRAKGVGWATGMGRVALTTGPLVTGYLLAAKLPSSQVLQLIAAPYVVVICMCVALGILWRQRMTGSGAEPAGTPAPQV